ncbi:hypothetical protein CKM354_000789400 [Cercospora kikuchii]|uniref:Uncharacterized protein n=1 Tax=Cercospora kikuchii TaxID=84275 RepID=A0A9P3FER9_9PEZI|nr:uncharacterized protein CKM354_000789400 [Cercospora kikuchii]GIZ44703.1 hypothetical protein CKM354_000789400 [Cercospora kikuchii]
MLSKSMPSIILFGLGAQAVSFTSWSGLTCRGQLPVKDQAMYPYACYSAGLDPSAIKASSLENKANSDAYTEVYADADCKEYRSTIKYNDFCINANFQAARLFIPPIGLKAFPVLEARNLTMQDLLQAPFEDVTSEEQDMLDNELDAALLEIDASMDTRGKSDVPRRTKSRPGMTLLPSRAVNDRITSETDPNVQGFVTADDNSPGDTGGFRFANNQQRSDWAYTLFQRLSRYRDSNPGSQSYTGSQTVGNHDLDVDIDLSSKTFGSLRAGLLRTWVVMFARQRENHAHQVWDLYDNNILLATTSFKAFCIGA